MPSTRRKEESSSALAGNESSLVKSKAESAGFFWRVGLLKLRVQSAIRPSLSEREKGAKGTFSGRLLLLPPPLAESIGPHPSGLKGTAPMSKDPTIGAGFVGGDESAKITGVGWCALL